MENENDKLKKLSKKDVLTLYTNKLSVEELEQYKKKQKKLNKAIAQDKYQRSDKGKEALKKAMQKANYKEKEKLDKLCGRITSNKYLIKHLLDKLVEDQAITIINNT